MRSISISQKLIYACKIKFRVVLGVWPQVLDGYRKQGCNGSGEQTGLWYDIKLTFKALWQGAWSLQKLESHQRPPSSCPPLSCLLPLPSPNTWRRVAPIHRQRRTLRMILDSVSSEAGIAGHLSTGINAEATKLIGMKYRSHPPDLYPALQSLWW